MRCLPRLLYLLSCIYNRLTRPVTLGVRLLLIQDEKVLLVKHTYQPSWYLPGGGVERGETLVQAARREAREEVGATLGKLRLFGIYTNFYGFKSDHVVVFACEDVALTGKTDREIEHFAWFALDALPDDVSPGSRHRILEYIESGIIPTVDMW